MFIGLAIMIALPVAATNAVTIGATFANSTAHVHIPSPPIVDQLMSKVIPRIALLARGDGERVFSTTTAVTGTGCVSAPS